MIDYKKLKLAHEIAEKKCFYLSTNIVNGDDGDRYLKFDSTLIPHDEETYYFDNLDELIAKLQSLTEPKTKYQIGQVVWRLSDEDTPERVCIKDIDPDSEEMYLDDDDNWWFEEQLYLSREALIEAQICYWRSLREPSEQLRSGDTCMKFSKISTRFDDVSMTPTFEGDVKGFKCEHESDGTFRNINNPRDTNHFETPIFQPKCIKCGEFY